MRLILVVSVLTNTTFFLFNPTGARSASFGNQNPQPLLDDATSETELKKDVSQIHFWIELTGSAVRHVAFRQHSIFHRSFESKVHAIRLQI
ncbi:MAG: hypothetical protein AB7K24_28305 [Gemmataceae bacterium]